MGCTSGRTHSIMRLANFWLFAPSHVLPNKALPQATSPAATVAFTAALRKNCERRLCFRRQRLELRAVQHDHIRARQLRGGGHCYARHGDAGLLERGGVISAECLSVTRDEHAQRGSVQR